MVATISINPQVVTNAAGTFGIDWDGLIQGTAYPDPAVRYFLASGFLANTETLPMWGGVGISEAIPTPQGAPPTTPSASLGGPIIRATNVTGGSTAGNLTGFSVFDQAYGMINSPQSPVPLAPSYGQVMFYRLGSGARIAVALDPTLASLEGDVITEQVSWDYAQQRLIPYVAAYPANVLTSLTWASTSGGQVTASTTTAHGLSVGSVFTLSGNVPVDYNGTFTALSGTTGNVIVYALATNPGSATTLGQLNAGGGAAPVEILRVYNSNCMTVSYNSATGSATWNYNSSAAVILI